MNFSTLSKQIRLFLNGTILLASISMFLHHDVAAGNFDPCGMKRARTKLVLSSFSFPLHLPQAAPSQFLLFNQKIGKGKSEIVSGRLITDDEIDWGKSTFLPNFSFCMDQSEGQ